MKLKKILALLMAVLFVMLCGCRAKVTRPPRIKVDQSGSFAYEALTDGKLKIIVYNGFDIKYGVKRMNIPSEIDGQKITRIKNGTFEEFDALTGIVIPDSITEIEDDVFRFWDELEFIEVDKNNNNYLSEDGVLFDKEKKKIVRCTNKIEGTYVIPKSVEEIGKYAFSACRNLTLINIPDGMTEIGGYAFAYCFKLTSINIPDSVTRINEKAFYSDGLTSITIPSSVKYIGEAAFWGCNDLDDIFFDGSEEEWNTIKIENYNEMLTMYRDVHYNKNNE